MLNNEIKNTIETSVLCWVATVDADNTPNVSPKEMFTYLDNTTLLVANIASPNTVANIRQNPNVCVSFVDIFVQKGYKLKGVATIIDKKDPRFSSVLKPLTDIYSDKFPVLGVMSIEVTQVNKIVAPSYYLFPETTEKSQIESAMKTYKVMPLIN